jgi:hypothetical protein
VSFNTIKTEVIARLGGRTDISSRVETWINDAYFELCLSPRFSFYELDKSNTFTTVVNLREYNIEGFGDVWFLLGLRDVTNERKLKKSHWTVFDAKSQPTAATTQTATHYARFGDFVELDPTPGSIYTIKARYRRRPTELSAGTDHPLGREWDEPITVLAVVKGYEALEQPEKAASQRTLLEQILSLREEPESLEDMDLDDLTIGVRFE